jgi:hypothetical protein
VRNIYIHTNIRSHFGSRAQNKVKESTWPRVIALNYADHDDFDDDGGSQFGQCGAKKAPHGNHLGLCQGQ